DGIRDRNVTGVQTCALPISQWLPARYHEVRKRAEAQAKALARGLIRSSYLCSRIRGIDASSREIGCRPETFATPFRYLRNILVQIGRASCRGRARGGGGCCA